MAEKKLTDEQRKEIAESYFANDKTLLQLAAEYDVSKTTIWRVIHNSGIMEEEERKADIRTRFSLLKLKNASTDAVEKLLNMLEKERDAKSEYIDIQLIQQVLDRAGVRVVKEDKQDLKVHISTGEIKLGVPDHSKDKV
jgi:predicted DNA-binding protein YlxM (UPF0122 family)